MGSTICAIVCRRYFYAAGSSVACMNAGKQTASLRCVHGVGHHTSSGHCMAEPCSRLHSIEAKATRSERMHTKVTVPSPASVHDAFTRGGVMGSLCARTCISCPHWMIEMKNLALYCIIIGAMKDCLSSAQICIRWMLRRDRPNMHQNKADRGDIRHITAILESCHQSSSPGDALMHIRVMSIQAVTRRARRQH